MISCRMQQNIEKTVNTHVKEIQENKVYLWENKDGMDHVEKVAVRQSVTQIALTGENALARKKRSRAMHKLTMIYSKKLTNSLIYKQNKKRPKRVQGIEF